MTTDTRPFRLGFFAYLEGEKPQAEVYAETLQLFQTADELGFDNVWVAQHHFGHHGGLPSPFVFFTALAERTRHIGVLFTEHDMDVVFGHASRVLVLLRGEIIAAGSPDEIRADPKVRQAYLGDESSVVPA